MGCPFIVHGVLISWGSWLGRSTVYCIQPYHRDYLQRGEMMRLQWNSSNLDTIETEESVLINEMSIFQGLKSTHKHGIILYLERIKCPVETSVLISGVSL